MLAALAGMGLWRSRPFHGAAQPLQEGQPLLISAAISLSDVLKEQAPAFARAQRVPAPQFNLAASGTLQRQIEQGAPVDVILSAGDKPMDALEQAGLLLKGTRRNLIGNRLVLVAPIREKGRLGFRDLTSPRIRRIAIGDNAVPAGDYARQVLRHHQLDKALQPKLVPLHSVRAVAEAVASGNADAGFVYRSDAIGMRSLRITAMAPATSHKPILYSGAVLHRSRHPQRAKAYLQSLTSPEVRRAILRAGFSPLPAGR